MDRVVLETAIPTVSKIDTARGCRTCVNRHKIIQWRVGYLGVAPALAHGVEIVGHALHLPDIMWRTLVITLIGVFSDCADTHLVSGHRDPQSFGTKWYVGARNVVSDQSVAVYGSRYP